VVDYLGKALAVTILVLVVIGGMFLLSGGSTVDKLKNSIAPSTGGVTSDNSDKFVYEYKVNVGAPINGSYDYIVSLHVTNRTSDSICYTYKIESVKEGDPGFIHGFMKGFLKADEGEPICSQLSPEEISPKYNLVDSGTTVANMKKGNGYSYSYKYRDGVLVSLNYKYTVPYEGSSIPVELNEKFLGTSIPSTQSTNPSTVSTSTTSTAGESKQLVFSSENVSSISYRVVWDITKVDIVTTQTTGTETLEYNIVVNVVKRDNNGGACVKYSIVNVTQGTLGDAKTMTSQLLGYNPGEVKCVNIYNSNVQQIPYFLLDPGITNSIKLTGEDLNGEVGVQNGVVLSLAINTVNQITDENNNVIAEAPVSVHISVLNIK
jgi:hypothetical protein